MTVIVYRDGVMAADRMQTTGNISEPVRTKIFLVTPKDHVRLVVGLCGCTKGTAAILKHLEQNGTDAGALDLTHLDYKPDHTYGYAVSAYGTVWQIYGDGTCLEPEPQDYYVDGAGYEFAMGACAAGASAVQAVLLAGKHHLACGYGATSVNVKEYLTKGGGQTGHSEESLNDCKSSR